MHLEVVSPLEDLTTPIAWVWYKATLMLMAHVAQQSTFQVEAAVTRFALELVSGFRVHDIENGIRVR